MNKNILFVAAVCLFAAMAFSSCKTFSYQARGVEVENKTINSSPTVVDVRVDLNRRVSYADQRYVKYPQSKGIKNTEELALQAARYNCITMNHIDVVVDPIYKISFKGKKKAKIELTGYAGFYENPRTLVNDIETIKKYTMDDIQKYILFNNPELMQPVGAPVNITVPAAGR